MSVFLHSFCYTFDGGVTNGKIKNTIKNIKGE